MAPFGQVLCHGEVANESLAGLVVGLLQGQSLVKDETARPGKAAYVALLCAIGHEFKFEALQPFHSANYTWPMRNNNQIRNGRHCVFLMHVHLVFVTKYRGGVFTKQILDDLREVLRSVCAEFAAELVEFDGEDDHVHLLVNYPPKVSVSVLVNSLKGVSSRMIRQKQYPSIAKKLWGGALWSPSYFAGSCGGAPLGVIRQYIEQQQTPR
jgi:putative transposase